MMQTGNRNPRSDIESPRPIIQKSRAGTPPGGGPKPFRTRLRIATGMSLIIRFTGSIEDRRDRSLTASDSETAPGSASDEACEGAGFSVAVLLGVRVSDLHLASASMAERLDDQRAGNAAGRASWAAAPRCPEPRRMHLGDRLIELRVMLYASVTVIAVMQRPLTRRGPDRRSGRVTGFSDLVRAIMGAGILQSPSAHVQYE